MMGPAMFYRRWYPIGAQHSPRPAVGDLVALQHEVWRVIEVRDLPEDNWTDEERTASAVPARFPKAIQLRPVSLVDHPDPKQARARDRHVSSARVDWHVYQSDHYPVCSQCSEPMPCREEMGRRQAEKAIAKMSRYELPGVCPSCEKPVTARQKSMTFDDNVEVIGGPPVTFHLRSKCAWSAVQYEKRWAAADPTRRTTLSCTGHVTNHNDGTYECTELTACPGSQVEHPSWAMCRCPGCHARPWSWGHGCHPDPAARNLAAVST